MQQPNPNEQPQSYIDVLQETMQDEFPLLGEVTSGIIDHPDVVKTAPFKGAKVTKEGLKVMLPAMSIVTLEVR